MLAIFSLKRIIGGLAEVPLIATNVKRAMLKKRLENETEMTKDWDGTFFYIVTFSKRAKNTF